MAFANAKAIVISMKIKPYRGSLCLYGMLFLASVIWISLSGGSLPYMTFYTVLCVPFVSVVYVGIVNLTIRFHQEMPSHKVTKGELSTYRVRVENVGFLPFVKINLLFETRLASLSRLSAEQEISLRPDDRWEQSTALICRYAGTYNIGVTAYQIEDCFHLFRVERPIPTPFRAIVRPRLPEEAGPLPELDAIRNLLEMQTSLTESTLGSDLREYRQGDSPRRIHWKNSARTQKLLTRLPEPKEMQLIQVVMIPLPQTQEFSDVIRRDRFLETAVSVAYDFCRQKKPAVFYDPKGRILRKTVDSYESFWEFYENLPDEIRGVEKMDDKALRLWIEENCVKEGGVILLKEADDSEALLSVYTVY